MSAMFWMVIGTFIGWNLPQPTIASIFQQKAVDWLKSRF